MVRNDDDSNLCRLAGGAGSSDSSDCRVTVINYMNLLQGSDPSYSLYIRQCQGPELMLILLIRCIY